MIDNRGNPIKVKSIISEDKDNIQCKIKDINNNIMTVTKLYSSKSLNNPFVENHYNYIDENGNIIKVKKVLTNPTNHLSSHNL